MQCYAPAFSDSSHVLVDSETSSTGRSWSLRLIIRPGSSEVSGCEPQVTVELYGDHATLVGTLSFGPDSITYTTPTQVTIVNTNALLIYTSFLLTGSGQTLLLIPPTNSPVASFTDLSIGSLVMTGVIKGAPKNTTDWMGRLYRPSLFNQLPQNNAFAPIRFPTSGRAWMLLYPSALSLESDSYLYLTSNANETIARLRFSDAKNLSYNIQNGDSMDEIAVPLAQSLSAYPQVFVGVEGSRISITDPRDGSVVGEFVVPLPPGKSITGARSPQGLVNQSTTTSIPPHLRTNGNGNVTLGQTLVGQNAPDNLIQGTPSSIETDLIWEKIKAFFNSIVSKIGNKWVRYFLLFLAGLVILVVVFEAAKSFGESLG
jgi:hypothetical protein